MLQSSSLAVSVEHMGGINITYLAVTTEHLSATPPEKKICQVAKRCGGNTTVLAAQVGCVAAPLGTETGKLGAYQ